MLRRIEVKNESTGQWDGCVRGSYKLGMYMSEEGRFSNLRPTWWHLPDGVEQHTLRHYFSELGWSYCGKAMVRKAVEMGIEFRVLESESIAKHGWLVYQDEYQIVIRSEHIAPVVKPKEVYTTEKANYAAA